MEIPRKKQQTAQGKATLTWIIFGMCEIMLPMSMLNSLNHSIVVHMWCEICRDLKAVLKAWGPSHPEKVQFLLPLWSERITHTLSLKCRTRHVSDRARAHYSVSSGWTFHISRWEEEVGNPSHVEARRQNAQPGGCSSAMSTIIVTAHMCVHALHYIWVRNWCHFPGLVFSLF